MTGWHPVLRPIGRLLVIAQLALALQPLSVLAQEQGTLPFNPVAQAELQRLGKLNQDIEKAKAQRAKEAASPADQVSEHLAQSNELVKNLSRSSSGNRSSQITELKTQLDAVDQGTASVRAELEATRAELVRKNLPASIIARHDAEVAQFESRVTTFAGIAKKIKTKPGSEEEGIRVQNLY